MVDTSVIIAAFASWHEAHSAASRVIGEKPALIAHCALETYSVLTRLPSPHRVAPSLVVDFLAATFPELPLVMPASVSLDLPGQLARLGITGGAVYDALVATTARHYSATLVTLDSRALVTYRRVGVEVESLVGP